MQRTPATARLQIQKRHILTKKKTRPRQKNFRQNARKNPAFVFALLSPMANTADCEAVKKFRVPYTKRYNASRAK